MVDLDKFEQILQSHVDSFKVYASTIRTGSPSFDDIANIQVTAYGTKMRLKDLATFNFENPQTVVVHLFDDSIRNVVLNSLINDSQIGANVSDDGRLIRLKFFNLSVEDKQKKVKNLLDTLEKYKARIRRERHDINSKIKETIVREDEKVVYLDKVQSIVDRYISILDDISNNKREKIMM